MRFLIDQTSYDDLLSSKMHTHDCYVRGEEYLHHGYFKGVKYVVARALYAAINDAKAAGDEEALAHLLLHDEELRRCAAEANKKGINLASARQIGDPDPTDEEAVPTMTNRFDPVVPQTLEDAGLNVTFVTEMILKTIYFKGRVVGTAIADHLRISFYGMVGPILEQLRSQDFIDVGGQSGFGEGGYEYILTMKGNVRVQEAIQKTQYAGPTPVPLDQYIASCKSQTIKNVVVTRRNIRQAFADLVITEAVLNEVGPAVNSASSIFLFGYPGNGKTSIAERVTRLMGDAIYVPFAIETDGQVIKMFDPIVHTSLEESPPIGSDGMPLYDPRWVKIKRPVVIVGGELTLASLDLIYNSTAKYYEAPFQLKANGGMFLIDDFGRQACRPQELLNRWIVPLEKRYDYLTTITGKKIEVPFDQLIVFSTNLDPADLADDAFLRRIKFKINVADPPENQWRQIWQLVCKSRKVVYDDRGIDYMINKWFVPTNRNLRMCHPRDILDQMISMAKYNMEPVTFDPDLIDAACATYFVSGTTLKGARPKM